MAVQMDEKKVARTEKKKVDLMDASLVESWVESSVCGSVATMAAKSAGSMADF